MKKLFLSTLIVALVFVCTLTLVSCKKQCETCTFGDWQTITEPTCTVEGEKVRTCTVCETEERQPIEKLEHKVVSKEVKTKATCTTDGLEVLKCKHCDYLEERTIAASGHNYKEKTKSIVSCTKDGEVEYACKNCGDSYSEIIPATGHNWKSATCYEPKICSNCSEKQGSALGHTTKLGKCSRCGTFSIDNLNLTTDYLGKATTALKNAHASFMKINSQPTVEKMCSTLKNSFNYLAKTSQNCWLICQVIEGVPEFKNSYNAFSIIAALENDLSSVNIVAGNMKSYAELYVEVYKKMVNDLGDATEIMLEEGTEIKNKYGS